MKPSFPLFKLRTIGFVIAGVVLVLGGLYFFFMYRDQNDSFQEGGVSLPRMNDIPYHEPFRADIAESGNGNDLKVQIEQESNVFMDLDVYEFKTEPLDTSNWQTITNDELGFSFKIPQDWITEGCGMGFGAYGIPSCKNDDVEINLVIARKKVVRWEGEDFFFSINLLSKARDLTRIVALNQERLRNLEGGGGGVLRPSGIYKGYIDNIESVLLFSENPSIDLFFYDLWTNIDNSFLWIYGSEGSPAQVVPKGIFEAFLNSIQIQQVNKNNVQEAKTKVYTSDKWHFSVEYPADLNIFEDSNTVAFGYQNEPYTEYNIQMKEVPYDSTEEWLDAQREGNFSSEGYELISWLSNTGRKVALVAEYVLYDQGVNESIYGRYFDGIFVHDGVLYKTHVGGAIQFENYGVPQINSESLNFLSSFRLVL